MQTIFFMIGKDQINLTPNKRKCAHGQLGSLGLEYRLSNSYII